MYMTELFSILEDWSIVRDWESQNPHQHLRRRTRDLVLKIAYIHVWQKRGVIRSDFQNWHSQWSDDHARGKMHILVKRGLLKPIKGLHQ
jgi:hypothetical protein